VPRLDWHSCFPREIRARLCTIGQYGDESGHTHVSSQFMVSEETQVMKRASAQALRERLSSCRGEHWAGDLCLLLTESAREENEKERSVSLAGSGLKRFTRNGRRTLRLRPQDGDNHE